jgi:hypothetical protein
MNGVLKELTGQNKVLKEIPIPVKPSTPSDCCGVHPRPAHMGQTSVKTPDTKFHKNLPGESHAVPCEQMDRLTEGLRPLFATDS